jgi:NADH dehydrogenase/NADH:ubiquinone oxidoreductase subunit G
MITLTIDGKSIQVEEGTHVLDAALSHGINIPHMCYHPELSVSGGCRLCQVEVEGYAQPVTSCGLACSEGLVVQTQSERLTTIRRGIIDIFLADHPLDCVTCDKAGACLLQKYAYEFGLKETSFIPIYSKTLYQDDNPFFIRDHQYCILCGRCVRVCDEIVGVHAIDFAQRGFESHIATPYDGPMLDSTCVLYTGLPDSCLDAGFTPQTRARVGFRARGNDLRILRRRLQN